MTDEWKSLSKLAVKHRTIMNEVQEMEQKLQLSVSDAGIVHHFLVIHEEGIKKCDRAALTTFFAKIDCLIVALEVNCGHKDAGANRRDDSAWVTHLEGLERRRGRIDRYSLWFLMILYLKDLRAQPSSIRFLHTLYALRAAGPYYKARDLQGLRHRV